jgi:hypothetical protein
MTEPLEVDNYEMLGLFGMIEMFDEEGKVIEMFDEAGEMIYDERLRCKLSDNVVVLRDEDDRVFRDKPKIFPLSEIFEKKIFTIDELKTALKHREEDLKHLRIFLTHFRPQEDGRLSQKRDYWVKFKAWRYDIDDPKYTLEYIEELADKLPLRPNLIKRSNKGWHLIYVFNEFIERSIVESYKGYGKDENAHLQYMVYEILTKLFPLYLKELEPRLVNSFVSHNKIFC